jgi:dihydrofolate synthase/folylpolyglutamate synthase
VTPHDRLTARLTEVGQEFNHGFSLSLSRITAVLDALGRPQDRLPPTFHVAGTNGKGSTCAYLRAIAEAAGMKAHVFTSPNLIRVNERIRLAGTLIDDDQFLDAIARVAATNITVTYFELITAVGMLLFAEIPADILALETGLGGSFDSTNVIDKPQATIITPVDMDHAHLLGDTIAKIAGEKAGIIKAGRPLVLARQRPEARAVIAARAEELGAPILECGVEWDCWAKDGRMLVQTENRLLDLAMPGLLGPHQVDNAGLAVRAMLTLKPDMSDDVISAGLARVTWPARMQPIKAGPLAAPVLAAGGELWIDGGHNAHAGRALAQALDALDARVKRPLVLILGMLGTKDSDGFLAPLAPRLTGVVAVPVHASRAARDPADIVAFAKASGVHAEAAPDLHNAITRALALAPAPRVLICGSLYLAGEALAASRIELD